MISPGETTTSISISTIIPVSLTHANHLTLRFDLLKVAVFTGISVNDRIERSEKG